MIKTMIRALMGEYELLECERCGEWEPDYMLPACVQNIWAQANDIALHDDAELRED